MFCLSYSQFTFPKRLKVRIPYPISSSKDCADNTKHGGLIILIIILHALPVTCVLISHYRKLTYTGKFLIELYNYTLIMCSYRAIQLQITHSSIL